MKMLLFLTGILLFSLNIQVQSEENNYQIRNACNHVKLLRYWTECVGESCSSVDIFAQVENSSQNDKVVFVEVNSSRGWILYSNDAIKIKSFDVGQKRIGQLPVNFYKDSLRIASCNTQNGLEQSSTLQSRIIQSNVNYDLNLDSSGYPSSSSHTRSKRKTVNIRSSHRSSSHTRSKRKTVNIRRSHRQQITLISRKGCKFSIIIGKQITKKK